MYLWQEMKHQQQVHDSVCKQLIKSDECADLFRS